MAAHRAGAALLKRLRAHGDASGREIAESLFIRLRTSPSANGRSIARDC